MFNTSDILRLVENRESILPCIAIPRLGGISKIDVTQNLCGGKGKGTLTYAPRFQLEACDHIISEATEAGPICSLCFREKQREQEILPLSEQLTPDELEWACRVCKPCGLRNRCNFRLCARRGCDSHFEFFEGDGKCYCIDHLFQMEDALRRTEKGFVSYHATRFIDELLSDEMR